MQGALEIGIRPATANERYGNDQEGQGQRGLHNACLTSVSEKPLQAVLKPL